MAFTGQEEKKAQTLAKRMKLESQVHNLFSHQFNNHFHEVVVKLKIQSGTHTSHREGGRLFLLLLLLLLELTLSSALQLHTHLATSLPYFLEIPKSVTFVFFLIYLR